jgi:hypothetical protein
MPLKEVSAQTFGVLGQLHENERPSPCCSHAFPLLGDRKTPAGAIFPQENSDDCARFQDVLRRLYVQCKVMELVFHVTVVSCGAALSVTRHSQTTEEPTMAMQGSRTVASDETSSLISSDKVEGTAVYDRRGEKLGSIHSVMIDKISGKVAYAVSGPPMPRKPPNDITATTRCPGTC